jgi:hypothetical protein
VGIYLGKQLKQLDKPDAHNTQKTTLQAAAKVVSFLWPDFVSEKEMVLLANHAGSNACSSGTTTDWECFINHTHIFDEFGDNSGAVRQTTVSLSEGIDGIEVTYDEMHPDFIAACELGKNAAKLWAVKLSLDFPHEAYRVYYTQYDNPVVRFHKVRLQEPPYLSDEAIRAAAGDLKNALVYDTRHLASPISASQISIH